MPRHAIGCLILVFSIISHVFGGDGDISYHARLLTLDANEGIAAGDVDGDGRLDLVAGRNWFRGGDWAPRPLRQIEDWNGYVQSNGDYLFDVNGDGRLDVIAGSFLPTEIHWYENPGEEALRLGKLWPQHLLVDTGNTCNEGQMMQDIDGDGRPEWIVNSWKKDVPMVVWRLVEKPPAGKLEKGKLEKGKQQPADGGAIYEMKPHQLGDKANGHGLAVGDISGDGLPTSWSVKVGTSSRKATHGARPGPSIQIGNSIPVCQ